MGSLRLDADGVKQHSRLGRVIRLQFIAQALSNSCFVLSCLAVFDPAVLIGCSRGAAAALVSELDRLGLHSVYTSPKCASARDTLYILHSLSVVYMHFQ